MVAHTDTPQASPQAVFAQAVTLVLEAVIFENWLRFYFITEKPLSPEGEDALFIAIPDQAMTRMQELYPHLLPMAEALQNKEITLESSRTAICTYVVTELDGKRMPRDMSHTVFDSTTFQMEMHLFNTWVQAHEDQLDKSFMDFALWKSLFKEWRATEAVQEWATKFASAGLAKEGLGAEKASTTVQ